MRGKYMNKVKLLIAGVVLAIVSLGGVSAAHAASNVDVDLPNEAVTGGTSVVVPVALSGFTDAELTVRLVAGSGTLTLANPGTLVLNSGYPSFDTQTELSFHGTTAEIVAGLQSNLSWTAPGDSESSSLLSMRVEVTKYVSGSSYDPLTGHTYEFVESGLPWHDAYLAAKNMSKNGLNGHLAVITSAAEAEFVGTKTGAADIWFGATSDFNYVNEIRALVGHDPINFDSQLTGDYYWAGGPELGTQISVGLNTPVAVNGGYINWDSEFNSEPNNYYGGEACAVTNWIGVVAKWNDLPCSAAHSYLVEFETDLQIFETLVFTFDNITGDSKDVNPPPVDPVVDPEEPTVDLADTGFDAGLIAAIAILLIAAGAGLRVAARKK
jgi:hypothetical protein